MTRLEALKLIAAEYADCPLVVTLGATARELAGAARADNHLYVLDSMGLPPAIGLGLALGLEEAAGIDKVVVIEGDGEEIASGDSVLSHIWIGNGYTQKKAVSTYGGKTPMTWAITQGALPAGLTLAPSGSGDDSRTGRINGTPTASGTFSFTAQVTDADGKQASRAQTLTVKTSGDVPIQLPDANEFLSRISVATAPTGTPADLQQVMGTPYQVSPQQWAAISAPLEPAVVVAGAGSGKTALMAARVVYLVVTGQVRPDQVLGLTFTTKAASELRQRIRDALLAAGMLEELVGEQNGAREDDESVDAIEPTVVTYNAYAANLLSEHGLRIGHEPETRVITDASRYQLGARAVERFTGDVEFLSDHPPTVIQNLLALDGAMSEHLVSAEQVVAVDAEARAGFIAALERFAKTDHAAETERWNARARRIVERLQGVRGLTVSYALNTAGYGDADLTWDERDVALDRDTLRRALASGTPRVELEVIITQDRGTTTWHATARTRVLRDGEELLVAKRLREVFEAARVRA